MEKLGILSFLCVRRLSRLDLECRCLGFAIVFSSRHGNDPRSSVLRVTYANGFCDCLKAACRIAKGDSVLTSLHPHLCTFRFCPHT